MTLQRGDGRQPSDSRGVLGQVSRLRHHTRATAGELREFMSQMRGKSPRQVLGILSQSELVRATALATAGTLVLLAVFTFVPMLWPGDAPAKPAAAQPVAAQPTTPPTNTNAAQPAATAEDKSKTKAKQDDAAKKLGIDEVKNADPKKNPLDDLGNDLFKDIK